jgi:hypothetical protein
LSSNAWLYIMRDVGGNGLGDEWEMQFNTFDPLTDADGDGLNNLREFLAGTNPTNALSTLMLGAPALTTSGEITFGFEAAPQKSYVMECGNSLGTGGWQAVAVVLPANEPRTIGLTNPLPVGAPLRFYRLRTPAWP